MPGMPPILGLPGAGGRFRSRALDDSSRQDDTRLLDDMLIYGINPVLEALRAGASRRFASRRAPTAREPGDPRWRRRRASRSGACRRADLDRETPAPCTRAWWPRCRRRDAQRRGSARSGRRGAADRRARWHRGSAQPRSDPADGRRRRSATGSCGSRGTRPRLGGAAAKASAGAVAHVKIAEVVNIARAIEALKEAGVWTVGLAGEAADALRSRSISRCRPPWSSGPKAPACGDWCASGATGSCRFRCGDTCRA